MPEPTLLVTDLAFGVLLGCVFAVIAHGLNLIWGVAKIVNVAHGVFIMLGAYGAYFLSLYLGINPLLSAPVDAAIGLAVGAGFYFGFLHRELRGKESIGQQSEMVPLVATFGLSLFVSNLALRLWTGNFVGIPWSPGSIRLGFLQLPLGALYVAIASVAIIAFSHIFLSRTYLGNAIRAYSQDIPATQLMGINPTFVAAVGTALGFSVTMAGRDPHSAWLAGGRDSRAGARRCPDCLTSLVRSASGTTSGSLACAAIF